MRWAKRQTTGSASRKAVLMALADYADEHGCAWPSQDRIATETEMTSRSVRSCIADLVELGLVTRKTKRNADGTRATDRLYLALDNDQRKEIPVAKTPPENSSGGCQPPENGDKTTGKSLPNHRKQLPGNPQYNNHQNGSDANASGDPAPPAAVPVLSLTDQLWMDGLAALVGMGAEEKGARRQIGWWLRLTRQDPGRVLWAINEAVTIGTANPIPFVTRLLSEREDRPRSDKSASSKRSPLSLLADQLGLNDDGSHHAADDFGNGPVLDLAAYGGSDSPLQELLGGDPERSPPQAYPRLAYAARG